MTNILAFSFTMSPSAMVGVITPLEELSQRGMLTFKFIESLKVQKEDIAQADVVISVRGSEHIDLQIISECRRFNKYIIYFLDDDLFDVPEKTYCFEYYSRKYVRKNITEIMQLSNCLWTTNKNITARFGSIFEKTAITNAPALLLEEEEVVNFQENKDIIRIGFSGSKDHEFFVDNLLANPIKNICEKYANVKFEFFGVRPAFIDQSYSGNIKHIPFQNNHSSYKNIIKERKWDIALAPLPESNFTSCKYFNKFLEYGAIGSAGIYSKVEPYTYIIQHGENGLLTDNKPQSWFEALVELIENPSLRYQIARNALNKLRQDFTVTKVAEDILSQIPEFLSFKAQKISKEEVKLKNFDKIFTLIEKIYFSLKREGLHFPAYLKEKLLKW